MPAPLVAAGIGAGIGAGVGGLFGVGLELAQKFDDNPANDKFDWGSVGKGALAGGVMGLGTGLMVPGAGAAAATGGAAARGGMGALGRQFAGFQIAKTGALGTSGTGHTSASDAPPIALPTPESAYATNSQPGYID